jgi:hypothetical protein
LLAEETFVSREINHKIKGFQDTVTNTAIKDNLRKLKLGKYYIRGLIGEIEKCDLTLYKEFLSKVKIFHSQTNEIFLEELIKKELIEACKSSHSVAESIYTEFDKGFSKWWQLNKNVSWLRKNAQLCQDVVTHLITELNEISEP